MRSPCAPGPRLETGLHAGHVPGRLHDAAEHRVAGEQLDREVGHRRGRGLADVGDDRQVDLAVPDRVDRAADVHVVVGLADRLDPRGAVQPDHHLGAGVAALVGRGRVEPDVVGGVVLLRPAGRRALGGPVRAHRAELRDLRREGRADGAVAEVAAPVDRRVARRALVVHVLGDVDGEAGVERRDALRGGGTPAVVLHDVLGAGHGRGAVLVADLRGRRRPHRVPDEHAAQCHARRQHGRDQVPGPAGGPRARPSDRGPATDDPVRLLRHDLFVPPVTCAGRDAAAVRSVPRW